jgi:small subunit ribosomal protein S1
MADLAQSGANGQDASDLELFEKYLSEDMDLDMPDRGDLREGVIVEVRPTELLVNVGSKRDGVVPQSDLARLDPTYVKGLREGMTVDVVVSKQPEDDGVFVLSMADALQQRDWLTAQQMLESGEISEHKVIGYNKGGLTVEFNHLRGFVPASHVVDMPRNLSEDQRREELEGRINGSMRLKVIEVDPKRRRLVMSQMLAEREYRSQAKEALFKKLTVGDVVTGTVRSMRSFGAFIDIGGVDGLLHVSEIGFGNVNHPREALAVGQEVQVQVIRIDTDNQRVGLSRKKLAGQPVGRHRGALQRRRGGAGHGHAHRRVWRLCPARAGRRRLDPHQRNRRHCRRRAAAHDQAWRQGDRKGAARRSEAPTHWLEHPPGAGRRGHSRAKMV